MNETMRPRRRGLIFLRARRRDRQCERATTAADGVRVAAGRHTGHQADDARARRSLYAVFDRLTKLDAEYTDEDPGPMPPPRATTATTARFTPKQGQYLAFIYYYTKIHGAPPAEADLRRHFQVSPPVVHQMILTLERRGLIERSPGKARSITLRLSRSELPDLE